MKHFLITNLKRQNMGPIVTTEKGLAEMQNSAVLKGNIHVIGECDSGGNLIKEIAQNNFIAKAPVREIAIPAVEGQQASKKTITADIDSDDDMPLDPDFLTDFSNLQDNGNNQPEPGPEQGSGAAKEEKQKGKRGGKRRAE